MKISEDKFQELVYSWLSESFAHVEAEVVLEDSGRRPDFIAYTPFDSYVIEVENDWTSIKDGLGQCVMYEAETDMTPILVLPADTVDITELEIIESVEHSPKIITL